MRSKPALDYSMRVGWPGAFILGTIFVATKSSPRGRDDGDLDFTKFAERAGCPTRRRRGPADLRKCFRMANASPEMVSCAQRYDGLNFRTGEWIFMSTMNRAKLPEIYGSSVRAARVPSA